MDYNRLKKTLIKHEALILGLYTCSADKLTIGVGHNIQDNGISENAAMFILGEDIENSERELRKFDFFEKLSDVRQEVLLNLHFNIGHKKFLGFKKMIKALEQGDFDKAADEMKDSKWFYQVKRRGVELVMAMRNNKLEV